MLGFLPIPADDELLWSTIARSCDVSGPIFKHLLTSPRGLTSVTNPSSLERLASMVDRDSWNPDQVIRDRTIYPYFQALPAKFYLNLLKAAKSASGISPNNASKYLLGKTRSDNRLYFCEICISEAEEKKGFIYLKRSHHLPGVFYCAEHSCWLSESLSVRYRDPSLQTIRDEVRRLDHLGISESDAEYIAIQSVCALNGKPFVAAGESLRALATELRWVGPTGNFIGSKLHDGWNAKYSRLMGEVGLVGLSDPQWIRSLYRSVVSNRRAVHPLWQILLEKLLRDEANNDPQFDLFGDRRGGVMRCPSPLCKKKIFVNLGANFTCNTCGFSFWVSRKRPTVGRILDRGMKWKNALKAMLDDETPLKQIAKTLGSSPTNVKREAAELGFLARWKKPPARHVYEVSTKVLLQSREEWLRLRQTYPKKSRKQLRELSPRLWKWLHRNDRSWLEKRSPPKLSKGAVTDELF